MLLNLIIGTIGSDPIGRVIDEDTTKPRTRLIEFRRGGKEVLAGQVAAIQAADLLRLPPFGVRYSARTGGRNWTTSPSCWGLHERRPRGQAARPVMAAVEQLEQDMRAEGGMVDSVAEKAF